MAKIKNRKRKEEARLSSMPLMNHSVSGTATESRSKRKQNKAQDSVLRMGRQGSSKEPSKGQEGRKNKRPTEDTEQSASINVSVFYKRNFPGKKQQRSDEKIDRAVSKEEGDPDQSSPRKKARKSIPTAHVASARKPDTKVHSTAPISREKRLRSFEKQPTNVSLEKVDVTKPSPVKKTRSSTDGKPNKKQGFSNHSPKKKRLRSYDNQSTIISSMETDATKPLELEKTQGTMKTHSTKVTPVSSLMKNATPVLSKKEGKKETSDSSLGKSGLNKNIPNKRILRTLNNSSNKSSSTMQELGDSGRSSPRSLYDFTADSPILDNQSSSVDKTDKTSKTGYKAKTARESKKCKPAVKQTRLRKNTDASLITPKTRRCQVVLKPVDQNKPVSKKIKVKAVVHSQELGDSISPILANTSGKNKQSSVVAESKDTKQKGRKGKTKKVCPNNKPGAMPIPKMPSVSFLDTEIFSEPYEDDSGIFLSPKNVKPHVNKSKPQETPELSKVLKDKHFRSIDCSFNVDKIQSTSTPNPEPKADSDSVRNQIHGSGEPKLDPPVFSPVKNIDTPATSDYGSMESAGTPTPEKGEGEREQSPSPAFSLDDDTDPLSLNKSSEKSYKRSRKKFQKARYSSQRTEMLAVWEQLKFQIEALQRSAQTLPMVSKVDQWAEKMNSEMQDIENFELSIEG